MAKVKIISEEGSVLHIKPTYGLCIQIACNSGSYKWTRWIAVLFVIAAGVLIGLGIANVITPMGSGATVGLVVLMAIAAFIFLYKPSQILVNNEDTVVSKAAYDMAVANGTEDKLFRQWD